MNGFMRALRNFTRAGERDVLDALRAQADAARQAATLCAAVALDADPPANAGDRIRTIERDGDEARHRVSELLTTTLAVPIDREDSARLSRSIDDVVNNLRDFVVEHELYGVRHPALLLEPVLDRVSEGVDALTRSIDALGQSPKDAGEAARRIRRNGVRDAYQRAMADLLQGEVTAEVLQQRELLRRLDVVGLRLGEAADALSDGALKRRA